jgi:hypothetical protein
MECRARTEQWTLVKQLPSPRPPGLSPDAKAEYRQVHTLALDELDANIAAVKGRNWHTAVLRDEHFELARRLMVEHASEWIGPMRDARSGIDQFRARNSESTSRLQGDIQNRVGELSVLLSAAHASLRDLRAALDTPQASGMRWHS